MIIKFALRELRNQKKLSFLFALSLAVGLSAFLLVDTFRIGVEESLGKKAKNILAADIGFGARRPLTEQEITAAEKRLPTPFEKTQVLETFSMLATQSNSRLVQLKAVEAEYPFYGEIDLQGKGLAQAEDFMRLQSSRQVWMYPEMMLQLGLEVGDQVKIGDLQFRVAEKILSDSSGMGTGFSFSPPVYLSVENLKATGLLGFGSRASYTQLFRLPEDTDIESLAENLFEHFDDPAIRVYTPKSSSEQVGRILGYMGDYMGLASLVAIFLTAFGCGYLYRSYLAERVRDVALYKSLGLRETQVEQLYCLHVVLLSLFAFVPLLLLTYFLSPQLSSLASDLAGASIELTLQARTVLLGIVIAIFGGLLSTYPMIRNLRETHPRALLLGAQSSSSSAKNWLYYLPLLVLYVVLSLYLSRSFKVGSAFILGVTFSLGFLIVFCQISLWFFRRLQDRGNFQWRWVLKSIIRNPESYRSGFIALSLGILLTLLLPQLEHGILKEIDLGDRKDRPNLFLFDIQQDQLSRLENWMSPWGDNIQVLSPMIRARLVKVNGSDFEKGDRQSMTREEERENRFRNRGFNLTYRDQLSDSESLKSGSFWTGPYQGEGLPEVSIETRFADRLDLELGDILDFEVQGVPIQGQITSTRKIRWTSFQPNFFVQFQPGVIEEAPGTFLMTLGGLSEQEKSDLQNQLVGKFPNVSVIDVSRIVTRISQIVSQVSLALKVMALIALCVGFLIFYSIVQRRSHEKRYQANLLRSLGASSAQVSKTYMGEFMVLGLNSVFFGLSLSLLAVYLLGQFVFDGAFAVDWSLIAWSVVGVTTISFLIVSASIKVLLNQNPKSLLQEASSQAS